MKAVLYARISTADKGQNLEVQSSELRAYCHRRGWEIVEECTDVITGKSSKRRGLDALMRHVQHRRIDVVVIIRLSRLGRSVSHLILIVEEMEQYGVKLVSVNEQIDLTTPNGRLMFHMFAAFGQFERDLISERVKAGLAYARLQGVKIGRPTRLNAITYSRICEMKASGASLRTIAQSIGISRSSVHKIVANTRTEGSLT